MDLAAETHGTSADRPAAASQRAPSVWAAPAPGWAREEQISLARWFVAPESNALGESTDAHLDAGPAVSRLPGLWANRYRYQANASSNLVTVGATQLFLGYAADGHPAITRRDLPDGPWRDPVDLAAALGSGVVDPDSHNTTAVGVARDGRVFAVADHHVDPLHIAVAPSIDALDRFRSYPRARVGLRDTDRVTYPHFVNDGAGRLYFSYREQEVGGGAPRFRWLIKRLDDDGRWRTIGELNRGTHLRLYLSQLVRCPSTGRLHATALWRDDDRERMRVAGATARQHDLFHLIFDPDTGRWLQYANTAGDEAVVDPPFLWQRRRGRAVTDVPHHILRTPPAGAVRNAGSLVVDEDGRPHLVHGMTDGRVMYRRFEPGRGWVATPLERSTSQAVFRLDGRIGLLTHDDDTISVRYPIERRSRPLATGFTSNAFRVHTDPGATRRGELSLLMVANSHASPGETTALLPMPMHVLRATVDTFGDVPVARSD